MRTGTNDRKILIQSALGLLLISIWPFLNFLQSNLGSTFDLVHLTLYAVITCTIAFLLALCLMVILRITLARSIFIVTVFVLMFFNYWYLRDWFGTTILNRLLSIGAWLIATAMCCYLALKASCRPKAASILMVFTGTLVLSSLINLLTQLSSPSRQSVTAYSEPTEKFKHRPPVFLLLLDGYARADTLKEALGFDNSSFLQSLEERGFSIVQESTANYPYTNGSVAALLNMNYHQEQSGKVVGFGKVFEKYLNGNNAVVRRFKAEGYHYALAPSGVWMKISCGSYEDICLGGEYTREMESVLISLTPLSSIGSLKHLLGLTADYLEPHKLVEHIDRLPNEVFMFAHFPGVHDYIHPISCDQIRFAGNIIFNADDTKFYLNSVKCMNQFMLPLIDKITTRFPDAIVVVQSDHGPFIGINTDPKLNERRWGIHNKEQFRNKYGTLSALRLPERCREYVRDDLSSVNVFRVIFACLSDSKPEYLLNRSFYPDIMTDRVHELRFE